MKDYKLRKEERGETPPPQVGEINKYSHQNYYFTTRTIHESKPVMDQSERVKGEKLLKMTQITTRNRKRWKFQLRIYDQKETVLKTARNNEHKNVGKKKKTWNVVVGPLHWVDNVGS